MVLSARWKARSSALVVHFQPVVSCSGPPDSVTVTRAAAPLKSANPLTGCIEAFRSSLVLLKQSKNRLPSRSVRSHIFLESSTIQSSEREFCALKSSYTVYPTGKPFETGWVDVGEGIEVGLLGVEVRVGLIRDVGVVVKVGSVKDVAVEVAAKPPGVSDAFGNRSRMSGRMPMSAAQMTPNSPMIAAM